MPQFNLFEDPYSEAPKVSFEDFAKPLQTAAISNLLKGKAIEQETQPVKQKKEDEKKAIYGPGPKAWWLPGRGQGKKKVLIVGPAPTQNEAVDFDRVIFKSDAATKLQQTLNRYVGVDLNEDCYLTNLIKYPIEAMDKISQDAISLCLPVLLEEIRQLKPKRIICLGSSVFKALTDVEADTDEYYGNFVDSKLTGCPVGLVYRS